MTVLLLSQCGCAGAFTVYLLGYFNNHLKLHRMWQTVQMHRNDVIPLSSFKWLSQSVAVRTLMLAKEHIASTAVFLMCCTVAEFCLKETLPNWLGGFLVLSLDDGIQGIHGSYILCMYPLFLGFCPDASFIYAPSLSLRNGPRKEEWWISNRITGGRVSWMHVRSKSGSSRLLQLK